MTMPARRYPRRELSAPLLVLFHGVLLRGLTRDLAEGGVGAAIPRRLTAGEKVILAFESSGFLCLGVVRHSDGFLHGFEFIDLDEQRRGMLKISAAIAEPPRPY